MLTRQSGVARQFCRIYGVENAANTEKYYIAWNPHRKKWYRHHPQTSPVWQEIEETELRQLLIKLLDDADYDKSFIDGTVKLLRDFMWNEKWDDLDNKIPLQNGILNPMTKELQPHCSTNFVTWCLPFEYDPNATCEPIEQWLLEAMQGHQDRVELLLAYSYCILFGKTEFQRFLEVVGPGGTGKSTFLKLAEALIGKENVFITSFRRLSRGNFQTYGMIGKRLIVIPDSEEDFSGSIALLKMLTGEDAIPFEIKFGEQGQFISQALVLIAGNTAMPKADSAIDRRRILIPFEHQVLPEKRRDLSKEFAPYLPGLFNQVLKMTPERVEQLIRQTEQFVPSLKDSNRELLMVNHPLAAWFFDCLEFNPDGQTFVGKGNEAPSEKLYPSYLKYCQENQTKPISLRLFSAKLVDLCHQLQSKVTKSRDWQRGSFFTGLAIKKSIKEQQAIVPLPPIGKTA